MFQLKPDGFAEASFNAITHDGLAESFWCSKTDMRTGRDSSDQAESGKERTRVTGPLVINLSEVAGTQDPDTFGKAWYPGYLSELTVSFLRPMARRREMTACPSAVFMRDRKPCVLARRRLFGWKVRFGIVFYLEMESEITIIQQVGARDSTQFPDRVRLGPSAGSYVSYQSFAIASSMAAVNSASAIAVLMNSSWRAPLHNPIAFHPFWVGTVM
jgi:hypothetical protein